MLDSDGQDLVRLLRPSQTQSESVIRAQFCVTWLTTLDAVAVLEVLEGKRSRIRTGLYVDADFQLAGFSYNLELVRLLAPAHAAQRRVADCTE